MLIELFGYLGSVLVVVSMLMSSVVKLRVINTIGSVISGTYALVIGSVPLALMNISLVIINLYNLFKLLKTDQEYEMVSGKADDASVQYFLNYYKEDIKAYFPDFAKNKMQVNSAYMVYCNANPAGILLGNKNENKEIELVLDYTTPVYRDCSVGKYLYSKLAGQGIRRLVLKNPASKHEAYLAKMGFTSENGTYVKIL